MVDKRPAARAGAYPGSTIGESERPVQDETTDAIGCRPGVRQRHSITPYGRCGHYPDRLHELTRVVLLPEAACRLILLLYPWVCYRCTESHRASGRCAIAAIGGRSDARGAGPSPHGDGRGLKDSAGECPAAPAWVVSSYALRGRKSRLRKGGGSKSLMRKCAKASATVPLPSTVFPGLCGPAVRPESAGP
jgi:hypothetical protein